MRRGVLGHPSPVTDTTTVPEATGLTTREIEALIPHRWPFLLVDRIIEQYHAPGGPGIRMDSHIYPGYEVPPYYDSLLGKLIVWGPDRATAIARSRAALEELLVDGVTTNIDIHRALLDNETFLEGRMTTNLLDRVGGAAFLAAAAR